MRGDGFLRLLFVLYCLEAGAFLTVAPWLAGWDHLSATLPFPALQTLLASNVARAACSGFGVVHLLWALHDIVTWNQASANATRQAPRATADLTDSGRDQQP
jgi:hypothetical protein